MEPDCVASCLGFDQVSRRIGASSTGAACGVRRRTPPGGEVGYVLRMTSVAVDGCESETGQSRSRRLLMDEGRGARPGDDLQGGQGMTSARRHRQQIRAYRKGRGPSSDGPCVVHKRSGAACQRRRVGTCAAAAWAWVVGGRAAQTGVPSVQYSGTGSAAAGMLLQTVLATDQEVLIPRRLEVRLGNHEVAGQSGIASTSGERWALGTRFAGADAR